MGEDKEVKGPAANEKERELTEGQGHWENTADGPVLVP